MKLCTLIPAVVLGLTVFVQAQPVTAPPEPTAGAAKAPNMIADGLVTLSSGTLADVIAEIERRIGRWPQLASGGKPAMPNLFYGTDADNAVVPGALHLRDVSPLQAVALAAAAAGCSLEPVLAPKEAPDASVQKVIGYRIIRGSDLFRLPSSVDPMEPALVGIGLALAKTNGNIVVGQIVPGSPAAASPAIRPGQRILRVAEGDQEPMDVTGLGLEEVVQLIRGAPGTVVKITLGGDSDKGPTEQVVALVRSRIPGIPSNGTSVAPKVRVVDPMAGIYGSSGSGGGGMTPADSPSSIKPGTTNRRVSVPQAAQRSEASVRVYAMGSVLSGSRDEIVAKEDHLRELIAVAIDMAGIKADRRPDLKFHTQSRALIVKATDWQQEIIEQVIIALKENATQPATPAKH